MNEAQRHAAQGMGEAPAEDFAGDHFANDQAVESAALASAAAIQHLVSERNALRNRLLAQERDLAAMRALNEDLRRKLVMLHQHFVDAAKNMVGRFEQFGGTLREVVQEAHTGPQPREDGAPPASLAQRLAEQAQAPAQTAKANGAEPPAA
jgi:hypothetical protein